MTCGITNLIPKVFAPSWKFKKLKQIPRNTGGLKKRAAKIRGKRLDKELKNNVTKNICPETKNVRILLDSMELDIEATQVLAQRKDLKTFLDMIVIHRETHKKFIVELKRGCKYRRCATSDGKLLHQTSNLTDCLLYQHQLQTLIGRWLAGHEYDYGVLLIYVNEEEIEMFQECDFVAELSELGKQSLLQYACKKQKRKKISKKQNQIL